MIIKSQIQKILTVIIIHVKLIKYKYYVKTKLAYHFIYKPIIQKEIRSKIIVIKLN